MLPGTNFEVETLRTWRENPKKFVWDNFKVKLDAWQEEFFETLPLQDASKRRMALVACAGPGKSAVEAMAGWWFMSTMGTPSEHPKGLAISTTSDNLNDNLWPEFQKWRLRSGYLQKYFDWSASAVWCKQYPDTWFISTRTWNRSATPEEQGRTLSGLHSGYVLVLIDESADIPVSVLKAANQALVRCRWGKIVQAGNPISQNGMLYVATTEEADRWHTINITGDPDDPKRSPRVDIGEARLAIAKHGRSDPWVMAYILGQFPPVGFNQLISIQDVFAAQERSYSLGDIAHAQKRIGVDAARFGDDPWIFAPRQGLIAYPMLELRGLRTEAIVGRLMKGIIKFESDLELVDGTGGFGAGVIDGLITANRTPVEVQYSGRADDPRYVNKRTEMYFELSKWIKRGQLPKDRILQKELTCMQYTFHNGKFKLEDKEQIKKRLGFSPNRADALAMTFAMVEMPNAQTLEARERALERAQARQIEREDDAYDPYADEHMI